MAALKELLKPIQEELSELNQKVTQLDSKVTQLDSKLTLHLADFADFKGVYLKGMLMKESSE